MNLILGDCEEKLKELSDNSIDAIVTDPPAGISFMGKSWDKDKGGRDEWIKWMSGIAKECLRVIKPGGHALVWQLPRTSHWSAMAWEDGGWEIRDIVHHLFGSGFPKSLDIGKGIDKKDGAEREIIGRYEFPDGANRIKERTLKSVQIGQLHGNKHTPITAPATEAAKKWDGWGTALKPACEHWILFRKPIEGTVAENVLKHGVGGINIDECRVGDETLINQQKDFSPVHGNQFGNGSYLPNKNEFKRFPANVIHDGSDEIVEKFPNVKTGDSPHINGDSFNTFNQSEYKTGVFKGDSGSASRFFYCAKASQDDREEGLNGFNKDITQEYGLKNSVDDRKGRTQRERINSPRSNFHPTVKNIELMKYLCKLITPKDGVILDPFMGSGSTGKAAMLEGFDFIGIEQDESYFKIAESRIKYAKETPKQLELL